MLKFLSLWGQKIQQQLPSKAELYFGSFGLHGGRIIIFFATLTVVFSVFILIKITTPPSGIGWQIEHSKSSYKTFPQGKVFFSPDQSLSALGAVNKIVFGSGFPYVSELQGFDPRGIWYEFDIDVGEKYRSMTTGVLVPKIYGKAIIFLNG